MVFSTRAEICSFVVGRTCSSQKRDERCARARHQNASSPSLRDPRRTTQTLKRKTRRRFLLSPIIVFEFGREARGREQERVQNLLVQPSADGRRGKHHRQRGRQKQTLRVRTTIFMEHHRRRRTNGSGETAKRRVMGALADRFRRGDEEGDRCARRGETYRLSEFEHLKYAKCGNERIRTQRCGDVPG